MTDWAKECREEAANTFYTPLKEAWINVGGHIEKMEAALREVAKINNQRDRFSADIDAIIINALGEEP
jgi:hypothetical protein